MQLNQFNYPPYSETVMGEETVSNPNTNVNAPVVSPQVNEAAQAEVTNLVSSIVNLVPVTIRKWTYGVCGVVIIGGGAVWSSHTLDTSTNNVVAVIVASAGGIMSILSLVHTPKKTS